MKLNPDRRRWRADKIGDLANLAVAALIFGQFTADSFRLDLTIIAILFLLGGYLYSDFLLKRL